MRKIWTVEIINEDLPLTKPYTIAYKTFSTVTNIFVKIISHDGLVGLGVASPVADITGETEHACLDILNQKTSVLLSGEPYQELIRLQTLVAQEFKGFPAAMAAVDMALWDLFTQSLQMPLLRFWGQAIADLPTSITVGIKSIEESLTEIAEYRARGFRCIKIKLGSNIEFDLELLTKVFERFGDTIRVRVDMNQGYGWKDLQKFMRAIQLERLDLIEQPLPPAQDKDLQQLGAQEKMLLTADESMHSLSDAYRLLAEERSAFGLFNIKLMKCGGPSQGRKIGELAHWGKRGLMWGCMDESCIGISAALHTAYSLPNTRFIDLDGSFDLARDLARGGFTLIQGVIKPLDKPGLGVEWNE